MRLCPKCGGRFAFQAQACPLDGTPLVTQDQDQDTERLGPQEAREAIALAAVFAHSEEDEDEATIIQQTPDLAKSATLVESTVIQGSGGAMRAVKLDQPLATLEQAPRRKVVESRALSKAPEPGIDVGIPLARLRLDSHVEELDEDLTKPLQRKPQSHLGGQPKPPFERNETASGQLRALTAPAATARRFSPLWFVVLAFFLVLLLLLTLLIMR
jgi:hypothetical protein